MRKWQNLAPPNDPNSWYDVDGVWPTPVGSYETVDFLSGTNLTATGVGVSVVYYAFCAQTLSGTREYILADDCLFEYSGGTLTDRSGGIATWGLYPMMAQYGNITIMVNGVNAADTLSSSGGNFAVLSGAPKAEIVLVAANAVLMFNTSTSSDGWAASDVGDYTNWTSGEAATGRLIQTPGPITAAVPFGNDVIVFKADAIYRLRYVGGTVKWASEPIYRGVGVGVHPVNVNLCKYSCRAGSAGILFAGYHEILTGYVSSYYYYFDGVSAPRRVNPLTKIPIGRIEYNPQQDTFAVVNSAAATLGQTHFYCPTSDAWGYSSTPIPGAAAATYMPVSGDFSARGEKSTMPVFYATHTSNQVTRYAHGTPVGDIASSCYLQTAMAGSTDAKTLFSRLTPILRRRRDLGADSAALVVTTFRELTDTSAQVTSSSITESSTRKRFDFNYSDNFARFKVTFTALDVEVDDYLIAQKPAGKE